MRRSVIIGLATVIVIGGIAFAGFRAGWWPGTAAAAPEYTFQQSRIDELRGDISTAATISKDMTAANAAGKEVLLEQGHDVTAQACTASSDIRQAPQDIADFVKANCANGEVSPTSEFAEKSDGGGTAGNDPDPGAN